MLMACLLSIQGFGKAMVHQGAHTIRPVRHSFSRLAFSCAPAKQDKLQKWQHFHCGSFSAHHPHPPPCTKHAGRNRNPRGVGYVPRPSRARSQQPGSVADGVRRGSLRPTRIRLGKSIRLQIYRLYSTVYLCRAISRKACRRLVWTAEKPKQRGQ